MGGILCQSYRPKKRVSSQFATPKSWRCWAKFAWRTDLVRWTINRTIGSSKLALLENKQNCSYRFRFCVIREDWTASTSDNNLFGFHRWIRRVHCRSVGIKKRTTSCGGHAKKSVTFRAMEGCQQQILVPLNRYLFYPIKNSTVSRRLELSPLWRDAHRVGVWSSETHYVSYVNSY